MNLTKKVIYITAAGIFFLVFIFNLLHISNNFIWDDRYFIAFNNYYNECSNIKKYLNFNPFHVQPLPLISRPFTSISLLLDKCMFSDTTYLPKIFKIKNILLHAINAALLFLLLFKITNNLKISFLFSLYFAFNPVNLDLLNTATFRNYLFSLFFILIILIDVITRKKISIANIVLYTISLFFAEIPFFLSLIFFLYIKYIKQHINITKALVFTLIIINTFYILHRLPRGYYDNNSYLKSYSMSYTQSDKKLPLKHKNLYSEEKHENHNLTYKINNFAFFVFKLMKVFTLASNETNYKEIRTNFYYSLTSFTISILLIFLILFLIKQNPFYSLISSSVLLIAFIYSGFLFYIPNHFHNRFFYIPLFFMTIFISLVLNKIKFRYIMIYFTLNLFIFILTTHYNYIYYKNNYLFLLNEYEKSPTSKEIIKGLIYENLKYGNTLKAKELNEKLFKLNKDEKFYLKNEFIINVIENNYSKANGIYKKIISKKEDITLFKYIINVKFNKKYNNFPESPNSFEFKLIKYLIENSKIYINKKDFYTKELINFYKYSLKLPVKARIIYY